MIVKRATQVGNPVIRRKSKSVSQKAIASKKIKALVKNLTDSIHHHGLIGMAAPQIGVNLRIFVTEIRRTKLRKNQSLKNADTLRVYINPKLVLVSRKRVFGYEGCGSVTSGNLFGSVKRPKSVKVRAYNERGETFELNADKLLARVIQHEYDHIEGKIFLDRMTDMKSLMGKEEFVKKFGKK